MGKTPVNAGLVDLRGRVDAFVYRKLEGDTIVSRLPHKTEIPPSESQAAVRERFLQATKYARGIFEDPVLKQRYVELAERRSIAPGRLFAFILRDFIKPPEIKSIDCTRYHRHIGDGIRVVADDDGEITGVTVTLKDANGAVLESGPAVLQLQSYRYTATTEIPPEGPITLVVAVTDLAENTTEQSIVLRGTVPVIEAIDGSGYHGLVGNPVVVRASDDIAVTGVFVMLRSLADVELESGDAVLVDGRWRYVGQMAHPVPVLVDVAVHDAAGNTAEQRAQVGS